MKILLLGNGGREHSLAWRLSQCASVEQVILGGVNPGVIADGIECVDIDICNSEQVLAIARARGIDLIVAGPEAPLVAGVADVLRDNGFSVFGPNKDGAELEGSKAWMKQLLVDAGAPTAEHKTFHADELVDALTYLETLSAKTNSKTHIIKTDGLAGGKGVVVTDSLEEARETVKEYLSGEAFGDAGTTCVIEEAMFGPEISIFALCDGKDIVFVGDAQDHKRIFDNDEGLNTGGMGAYSPVPFIDDDLIKRVMVESIEPTVAELQRRGIDYRGVLYAGLMVTNTGPRLLEYNIRFGDPECQILMMRLDGDIAGILKACAEGAFATANVVDKVALKDECALTVVISAKGYPENPENGAVITGIDEANNVEGVKVFHAGTKEENGQLVVNGGRVLNVTAIGNTVEQARERAYKACELIKFDGMHYRKDIAYQAIS